MVLLKVLRSIMGLEVTLLTSKELLQLLLTLRWQWTADGIIFLLFWSARRKKVSIKSMMEPGSNKINKVRYDLSSFVFCLWQSTRDDEDYRIVGDTHGYYMYFYILYFKRNRLFEGRVWMKSLRVESSTQPRILIPLSLFYLTVGLDWTWDLDLGLSIPWQDCIGHFSLHV